VRAVALALAAFVLAVPSAAATPAGLKLLTRDDNRLALVYVDRPAPFVQPLLHPRPGVLGFSGDGRLISFGGTIVGRAKLPTRWLVWAPTGERAAYVTTQGGVVEWTPAGIRRLEPNGWGAQWWWSPSVAWSADGALAVARGSSIWVLRGGSARQVVRPIAPNCCTGGPDIPVPFAWAGDRVLWWDWPGSGSVASDGVSLYAGTQKLGVTLMYPDYTTVCGAHLAFAEGSDRESMDNKMIVFDGRDVSRDPKRSWASPACTPDGRLVASASRNLIPNRTDETHRAVWQLLPTRRRLTRPPWGWSDEDPRLFANGDVLFVRSRSTARKDASGGWIDTQKGRVMLLEHGKLRQVAQIGFTQPEDAFTYPVQFYGHYDWAQLLAVSP
jgi:hypothetical protein